MSKISKITDEQLREACASATSFRSCSISLGILGGSGFAALKIRILRSDIDISHFTGKTWNKGLRKHQHLSIMKYSTCISVKLKGQKGRPHTQKSRQKMSKSASNRTFSNNSRVKRYDVINPLDDQIVTVQGTWEKNMLNG